MYDDIIKIIKLFNIDTDHTYLRKLIHSLQLNRKFNFVVYDLIETRFIYIDSEKNDMFKDLPNHYLNNGYLFLKKILHQHDFASLVKEVITLMHQADYANRKIIKSENGGQVVKIKKQNGDWQIERIHLIYLNERPQKNIKVLLAFIEEDAINQDINITSREKEIFKLISSGYSAKIIAGKLSISETTVITHRKNLKQKLKVKNSAELIKKGYELNLLS